MRFKAKLEEPRALLGVLQICRSIQRDCIIRLQSSRTRFFTTVDMLDGVQVWMGCRTDFLFSDFRCESHYKEQSITFEIIGLQQLMHMLKQAETRQNNNRSSQTIVWLARSGNKPILKLSMQGVSQYLPDLSYDIPISILSDRDIEGMQAPPLEDDHVQVVIPSFFELTTFVDKIKSSACDSVTFFAQGYSTALSHSGSSGGGHKRSRNADGEGPRLATLHVHAENFLASFSLKYDAVEMIPRPRETESDEDGEDAEEEDQESGSQRRTHKAARRQRDEEEEEDNRPATVSVEVKKFARFFSAVRDINPARLSLYVVDQRALVLSVQALGSTTMVAYIPAKRE